MNGIIPKKFKKQKLRIKGWIAVTDLIAMFCFLVIDLAIVLPLTIIGIYAQILLFLILFLIMSFFLIQHNNSGMKIYKLFYYKWLFRASKKTFSSKSNSNNTSLLIPYKSLIDGIDDEIGIIQTDKLGTLGSSYLAAIEVQGFNLLIMSYEEQMKKLEQFSNVIRLIDCSCTLIKIDKEFDNSSFESRLDEIKNNLEKSPLTQKQLNSRMIQVNAMYKMVYSNKTSFNNLKKKYYFIFNARQKTELIDNVKRFIQNADQAGFNSKKLNKYDLVNLFNKILNPLAEEISKEKIDSNATDLKQLLKFSNCKFNGLTFQVKSFEKNESLSLKDAKTVGDNIYYSINTIREYPRIVNPCWLSTLMSIEGSVAVNISNPSRQNIINDLQKAIMNLRSNLNNVNKKELVAQRSMEKELEIYEQVVESLGSNSEQVKNINIYFMNYGFDKKQINEKFKKNKKMLSENGFTLDSLNYRQFQGFSGFLPEPTDPLLLNYGMNVPAWTIAISFPFLTSDLSDEKGLPIGVNMQGEPVIFDQFKLNKKRKNHNMIILGTSGSGKTTVAKKIIKDHLVQGRKVIAIDPEGEFRKLCSEFGGTMVDIGSGLEGRINPLQPYANLYSAMQEKKNQSIKEKNKNEPIWNEDVTKNIISNHLSFLQGFFEILLPDLLPKQIRIIRQNIQLLYNEWDAFKNIDDILHLPSNDYPTFTDLISFMKMRSIHFEYDNDEYQEVLDYLEFEFEGLGQYKNLYNGPSIVKSQENLFTVFDIASLFEKGQQNLIQAQLYLMTNFISREVKINDLNNGPKIILIIDDAHLLIDKDKPIVLDFIFQMIKSIRKRRGGIILIAQNTEDFLGNENIRKKTTTMMNNSQYHLLLNLSSKNIKDVKKIYENLGNGLSNTEIKFISNASQGQALFIVTENERHLVDIKLGKEELKVMENISE